MPSNYLTSLLNIPTNPRIFNMIENYIYLYHTDTYIVLPSFSDSITDQFAVDFSQSTPLSRSAPIYSYSKSGPRTIHFQFDLHRDMMTQINHNVSNARFTDADDDDYVEYIIRWFQAIALPVYNSSEKFVDPPIAALRLGNDIFIKGVPQSPAITYSYPMLETGRYAMVRLAFSINEIDPYDARTVMDMGSYRIGNASTLSTTLERSIFSVGTSYSSVEHGGGGASFGTEHGGGGASFSPQHGGGGSDF